MILAVLLIGSYLLGSLPFGLWIARQICGVDIRTLGSGNIGSTNVGRVCGPKIGALVLVLDTLKGFLPPFLGAHLIPNAPSSWIVLAALCAILGHNFSIWLRFQGGKGIAASLGALLGIAPLVGLAALGVFGITLLLTRWVSLGSILAAISLAPFSLLFYPKDPSRFLFGLLAGCMAVVKHRANVKRLLTGKEPKIHPFTKRVSPEGVPPLNLPTHIEKEEQKGQTTAEKSIHR